ncbi:SusD/RagB family nutrient-binding outer membrane lipoprotein [Dyadobacter arcticus]|uniref:Starch-binding associating with outer membrane n=1 Tax=Dyadobacter arcticus TaxID=1078754 RepID=A0ABX0UMZ9_9BACT|nr:SusD/RagB family nutrient-binding outer membrane lipoprotein [Dyadobacter arcticus]NIJ52461.1 hypothetical protein [Dyadobacter arcticus]
MKKTLTHALLICLISANACTSDFDEINKDPNSPTQVTIQLLLPQIVRDMMNSLLTETWGIGNIVIQQTAKNQFVNEDRYLWGERNNLWNAVYENMRDVNNILILAEKDKLDNNKAVALILKSWMFSIATDAYGDIPYSEAIKAKEGVLYAKYDAQEDIYKGILADLATANTLLSTGTDAISGDPLYGGNAAKWRKLANSLRIRYLMRISDRRDVSADLTAIIANPTAAPVFEGNADNGVYTYLAAAPDQFPEYSDRIGSFNEYRASKTMVDWLKSKKDPRLNVFFRATPVTENTPSPADDVFEGLPNGLDDVAAQTYNGGQQFQSRIGSLYYENSITPAGLSIAKGIIMTFPELQFVLAEAAEKGLINKPAEAYYNAGMKGSFDFYNVDPGNAYYQQAAVAYTGTKSEKLTKIGEQKWASLFYTGLEAWFDWRRTNIPALKPSATNQNENKIPVRFIYPIIEQALNGENRKAAVTRQGVDNINTKVWWDVK